MKINIIKIVLVISLFLVNTHMAVAGTGEKPFCYSSYHIQQNLDLVMNFGDNTDRQRTEIDVDLHVKEMPVTNALRTRYVKLAASDKGIRLFLFFVNPNASKTNGVELNLEKQYQDPFIVVADASTGRLLNLSSASEDRDTLKGYQSFYDLFQYSISDGEYQYKNSNGLYRANITTDNDVIVKTNQGYISDSNDGEKMKIEKNYLSITADNSGNECFYMKSSGEDIFTTALSTRAFVTGNSVVTVEADSRRALPTEHFFYTLTEDISIWPGNVDVRVISREEALEKMPAFMGKLASSLQDDTQFINAMIQGEELWKYLSESIEESGITDDLSKKLFWALDRIDTTNSVNALADLATSELSSRDHFRAVLALGSTSAPFDQNSVDILTGYLTNFASSEYSQPENLTFVRMLGAMASQRSTTDPVHSEQLKSLLYTQIGSFEDHVNAAVIDAIGNLKGAIDKEGESILAENLSTGSDKVKLSAALAFKRIPYNPENNDALFRQLEVENNYEIKNVLLEVMRKSNNNDGRVKQKLMSVLDDNSLRQQALKSIKTINYDFHETDIQVLEDKLRQENNSVNQRLLAAMILKHRREQNK